MPLRQVLHFRNYSETEAGAVAAAVNYGKLQAGTGAEAGRVTSGKRKSMFIAIVVLLPVLLAFLYMKYSGVSHHASVAVPQPDPVVANEPVETGSSRFSAPTAAPPAAAEVVAAATPTAASVVEQAVQSLWATEPDPTATPAPVSQPREVATNPNTNASPAGSKIPVAVIAGVLLLAVIAFMVLRGGRGATPAPASETPAEPADKLGEPEKAPEQPAPEEASQPAASEPKDKLHKRAPTTVSGAVLLCVCVHYIRHYHPVIFPLVLCAVGRHACCSWLTAV